MGQEVSGFKGGGATSSLLTTTKIQAWLGSDEVITRDRSTCLKNIEKNDDGEIDL